MCCSLPGPSVHMILQQEYCSGLPFPPPGDLPNPGVQSYLLCLLHCRQILYPLSRWGSPSGLFDPILHLSSPVTLLQSWLHSSLPLSSVQSLIRVGLFVILWTAACQASLSITNSRSPPKPMSIESVIPSNHLILCRPLLLRPSICPSIRVFTNESALHVRWPQYWSFSFNISPSSEHPGLISFRMDWLDLLAVQGTLKSLLQHHSSKTSILLHSAFFIVQLSHSYMTTGKIITLTRWTFVNKVMFLLFNTLSMLVITFLPRSNHLLISWLSHRLQWFWSPPK